MDKVKGSRRYIPKSSRIFLTKWNGGKNGTGVRSGETGSNKQKTCWQSIKVTWGRARHRLKKAVRG